MNRRLCGLLLASLLCTRTALAAAATAAPPPPASPEVPKPQIVDLGNGRYQVGPVQIDKTQHRFTVTGLVLRAEPPLEFLAVARHGRKGYESMLELDATAFEFNLACILIGLDGERASGRPGYHFDPQPVDGDRVAIDVSWQEGASTLTRPAESLLVDGDQPVPPEWVYTGSEFTRSGAYLAHIDGTLIGLVHDPSSVIEHHSGLGINTYGSIKTVSGAPAAQTPVVLTVRRLAAESEPAEDGPPLPGVNDEAVPDAASAPEGTPNAP
jgi:hypothetical protein